MSYTEYPKSAFSTQRWHRPVVLHDGVLGFRCAQWVDALHRVIHSSGYTIDFLMQGLSELKEGGNIVLVGLTGAVSNRSESSLAPFFSGTGVAANLQFPLISVSDPTLATSPSLGLAWYAGNQAINDLPQQIAMLLDGVAERADAHFLIFGGSGGGFAAMQIASLLRAPATVLVWNPQTKISDYAVKPVCDFVDAAFPDEGFSSGHCLALDRPAQVAYIEKFLASMGVRSDICSVRFPSGVRIIFLQNQNDWHVRRHAYPFMMSHTWRRIGCSSFVGGESDQFAMHFGNWGDGHIAPPKQVIESALMQLAAQGSLSKLALWLEAGGDGGCAAAEYFGWPGELTGTDFSVSHRIEDRVLSVTCVVDKRLKGLKFAYYLFNNGIRYAIQWYTEDPGVSFELPVDPGVLEVMVFVRDGYGGQCKRRIFLAKID
jgi:hypothetical protein